MAKLFARLRPGPLAAALCAVAFLATAAPAQEVAADCEALADILNGSAGGSGATCKVTLPRGDLEVRLLGAALPPGSGLTSWAAFHPVGDTAAMVMGDLALTSEELPRVLRGLVETGFDVTAVHRHMLGETPPMSFVHYAGVGAPAALARRVRAALERAPTAPGRAGEPADGRPGVVAGTDCGRIEQALGAATGSADRGPGYCKVTLPRSDLELRVRGAPMPASMGVASWFAFRQTRDGREAVVTGDLALTEAQVSPALSAVVGHGIDVVSLHNHMLFDEPRIVFFHFQARGEAEALARGLRAGLDAAGRNGGR